MTPEQLAEELRELSVALKRHARAESDDEGIPYPQLAVLKRLDADGPATTADLARGEAMTPQAMGAIVATLEAAGFATRRADANHGRKRLASITAAGRKALAANRVGRVRKTAALIAESFDKDEQRTLAAAFALLRRAFIT